VKLSSSSLIETELKIDCLQEKNIFLFQSNISKKRKITIQIAYVMKEQREVNIFEWVSRF
jgi:hypothetical protein